MYSTLIQKGVLTPAKIAALTGETRTNTYALLNKLEKLRLVRNVGQKTAKYQAENPSSLEILAEKRRKIVSKREQELKNSIPALLDIFYAHNEAPGSRTLTGRDGVKEVHRDVISSYACHASRASVFSRWDWYEVSLRTNHDAGGCLQKPCGNYDLW